MITFQATSFILGTAFGLFIGLLILKWVNHGAEADDKLEENEQLLENNCEDKNFCKETDLDDAKPIIPAFLRGKK